MSLDYFDIARRILAGPLDQCGVPKRETVDNFRVALMVVKVSEPFRNGVLFKFAGHTESFLPVLSEFLDEHWTDS